MLCSFYTHDAVLCTGATADIQAAIGLDIAGNRSIHIGLGFGFRFGLGFGFRLRQFIQHNIGHTDPTLGDLTPSGRTNGLLLQDSHCCAIV